ncbi:MAG TPA: aldehyde dehydrogenase family protein, partial [Gaiellaceae bacterium]|nr:aldehyde dehydrogenase family protein [Gaiellaceae bacterium]
MAELDRPGGSPAVPDDWTYAPAPESRDIVRLRERYGLFVGGEWIAAKETYETISPASEEPLAVIGQASAADVDSAVTAARTAFANGWSSLPGSERAKYLFRIARILQERAREFAVLESMNGGKPIKESRDVDLPLAAAHFFYYAGWADKLEYAFPNRRPRPVGVAGQIIPWNFPLLMLAWKIAPALACGNTVVLKPAETTPLTALLFCDVLRQAELPAGVVNIVTGDGRTGAALVEHDGVDKIAFTGSTEVGKAIQRRLAGTGTKLTLELGGKAANIVFDDCALDQVAAGVAGAGDDVDDARREVGLAAHVGEEQRRERGGLGRLEYDRVAGRERGRDLPGQHQQREVPRDDLPGDAECGRRRPVAQVPQLVGPPGVGEEVLRRGGDV